MELESRVTMDQSAHMLDLAARAAMRGVGLVEPNPLVGAVIVRDGKILGIGHHTRFGALHAEREAIASCRARGFDPRGSTMFVTLEPCKHHGKQPPCTDAIIEARIERVVIARPDPHAESGGGATVLRDAGIAVEYCDQSPLAIAISEPFVRRLTTGLPWVIAKWAQTIDGRIATRTGESQWISGAGSRQRVHRLRARVDAILTGLGTVLADDPMLTARGVRRIRRRARRVLIDTHLDVPIEAALVRTADAHPTTIACAKDIAVAQVAVEQRQRLEELGVEIMGVPTRLDGRMDLRLMLKALADHHSIASVLVESGPGLLGALFEADLIDEAVVYIAPLLLGDEHARAVAEGRVAERLSQGRRFTLVRSRRVGDDVELTYRRLRDEAGKSGSATESH